MELALDIIGERFTTLYQMSKPTYLSRDLFAYLEIGILTYINHGEGKWHGYQLVIQVH